MSLYFDLTVPSATCVVLKHWNKWLWLLLMAVSVAGSKATSLSWSLAVLPRRNPNLALAENPWWKKQQTYTTCKNRFCVNNLNLNLSISNYQTPYLWLSLYMMLVRMVLQMKCESRSLQYLLGPKQGRKGLQDGCPQGRGALWEHRTEPDERKTPQARQPRHQHGHNVLFCQPDRQRHTVTSKNWPDSDISKCLALCSQSQLALIH